MQFQPTLYNGRDYLYILRFTLIQVSKKSHWRIPVIALYTIHIDLTRLRRGPYVCVYVQTMAHDPVIYVIHFVLQVDTTQVISTSSLYS